MKQLGELPVARHLISLIHSGQTQDACAVPATILQKKIQTNVESFPLTAKRDAISENLGFLLYRREIWFIGTF